MSTHTQPAPNISTEHQRDGDARHPGDQLDRGQTSGHTTTQSAPNLSTDPADRPKDRGDTPGGNEQERVEDRPNVGTTTPEAYPKDQQGGGTA